MLGFFAAILMSISVSAYTIYTDTLAYKIVEKKVPTGTVVSVEVVKTWNLWNYQTVSLYKDYAFTNFALI